MNKSTIILLTFALLTGVLGIPVQSAVTQTVLPPDTAQITAYLNDHPLLTETGAEVLSVTTQGEALVIDISQALLPEGEYDETIFTQLHADLNQAFGIDQIFMTTYKIEGKPLEDWGRPLPDPDIQLELPIDRDLIPSGPLNGVKIALNPGHGIYWNEYWSLWMYQRAEFWGIREDTLNGEIMRYVQAALFNQGAIVIQLRELDLNASTGTSGYPAWYEGSREYAIALGLPSSIYDGSDTNYNSDIRARPYMANAYGADILIGLHNNGWDGTFSGTETYWDTDNHPGSQALANAVHNSLINTIRAEYDSSWVNRGIKASDSNYGEINYAQMPAILIELAFMDRQFPDNAYLHDEGFKLLAANAITQGVCDYLGVTCDNTPITLPQVVEAPVLTPAFGSGMCDSGWYRYPTERGQYAYLALNTATAAASTHRARWAPNLPISGEYKIEAFIPAHNTINWQCPTKTIADDTSQARYAIRHANGLTIHWVNQAPRSNDWVELGVYHFNDDTVASVTLSDLTLEPEQTTTINASAVRFTLVGNAGKEFHNTEWVPATWLTDGAMAPISRIRNFLTLHKSCLAAPISDADGTTIDIPTLIGTAAQTHTINPRVLLAIMQAEHNALTRCPDQTALANLMGLSPATTARLQINDAALMLREAQDALTTSGATSRGWITGAPMLTVDGVSVIPANDAITLLFDYTQLAGEVWGGDLPGENGAQGIYAAYDTYLLDAPLPVQIYSLYEPIFFR